MQRAKQDPVKLRAACARWREKHGAAWYEANRERIAARQGARRADIYAKRQPLQAEYANEYRRKYPEKVAAHAALAKAVRRGEVIKLPCFICGNEVTEAHHPAYSLPLVVTWLCKRHHTQLHMEFNND